MKTLAKALINAAAFLELSSDDVVNPDGAVKALESIAYTLHSASPEEISVIREALHEMTEVERAGAARADVLEFYEQFLENCGVTP
jgi:hypothetical protein